jgi:hypothetical protein
MVKRAVLGALCAVALVAGTAQAQVRATLTLTSGETVTGQLVDLGGVGYTMTVNGKERHIPQSDVAVINFTGGNVDWSQFNGTTVVVLRNGQTINGTLEDIGGRSPLRLTISTGNSTRDLRSSEVARIVMAKPSNTNTAATTGQTGQTVPGGTTITVNGNQNWTATGITVRKGDLLTLSSSGQIQLSSNTNDVATVNGATSNRYAPGSALPRTLAGALIGKIGNGQPFGIGSANTITAPDTGQLFLGVNDDSFGDNQGSFQVSVARQARGRLR